MPVIGSCLTHATKMDGRTLVASLIQKETQGQAPTQEMETAQIQMQAQFKNCMNV